MNLDDISIINPEFQTVPLAIFFSKDPRIGPCRFKTRCVLGRTPQLIFPLTPMLILRFGPQICVFYSFVTPIKPYIIIKIISKAIKRDQEMYIMPMKEKRFSRFWKSSLWTSFYVAVRSTQMLAEGQISDSNKTFQYNTSALNCVAFCRQFPTLSKQYRT